VSILIKGLDMPKDKAIAVVIHPDGTAYSAHICAGVCTEYLTDCTAVPVPPHGRLIDADAMQDSLSDLLRFPSNLVNGQWIVNAIREQPTIIEGDN